MSGDRIGIGPSGPLAPSPRAGRTERDQRNRTPFGAALGAGVTITTTTAAPLPPPTIVQLNAVRRLQAAQVSVAGRRRRRGLQQRQETVLTSGLGLIGVSANTTRTLLGS